MRGITEETLEDWAQSGYEPTMNTLLKECAELNPWQPIETAPKDRLILIYYLGLPDQGSFRSVEYMDHYEEEFRPTHWQELPSDPK